MEINPINLEREENELTAELFTILMSYDTYSLPALMVCCVWSSALLSMSPLSSASSSSLTTSVWLASIRVDTIVSSSSWADSACNVRESWTVSVSYIMLKHWWLALKLLLPESPFDSGFWCVLLNFGLCSSPTAYFDLFVIGLFLHRMVNNEDADTGEHWAVYWADERQQPVCMTWLIYNTDNTSTAITMIGWMLPNSKRGKCHWAHWLSVVQPFGSDTTLS